MDGDDVLTEYGTEHRIRPVLRLRITTLSVPKGFREIRQEFTDFAVVIDDG